MSIENVFADSRITQWGVLQGTDMSPQFGQAEAQKTVNMVNRKNFSFLKYINTQNPRSSH